VDDRVDAALGVFGVVWSAVALGARVVFTAAAAAAAGC
jgi:hypothetical protein